MIVLQVATLGAALFLLAITSLLLFAFMRVPDTMRAKASITCFICGIQIALAYLGLFDLGALLASNGIFSSGTELLHWYDISKYFMFAIVVATLVTGFLLGLERKADSAGQHSAPRTP
jgi:hypothetical protein